MATKAIESVSVLVVSRELAVLRPLWSIGESNCWQLETAGSGWEALERLQNGTSHNLLLLELPVGESDGLPMLRGLRRVQPQLPIILISHTNDVERWREAMRLGVREIIEYPFDEHQLEFAIRRNLNSAPFESASIPSDDIEPIGEGVFFVAASRAMRKIRVQAELFAQAHVPVLIVGEPGSGKSSAAQLIHALSARSGSKMLRVNCAGSPGRLLEEELFGCEKDVEAGFARARVGKLELCEKGTLLLDEIVGMPMEIQHTLLGVLQNKRLVRLNGDKPIGVDVRILATTSANIDHAVAAKRLREDLYYHLSAFTLQVPPLRQRKDAIPVLLQHFMQQLTKHYDLPARSFSQSVLDACQRYSWPGNLSELERFVKRYLLMPNCEIGTEQELAFRDVTDVGHLPTRFKAPMEETVGEIGERSPESLKSLVQGVRAEAERNAIVAALEKTGWNRKAAARMIKVSYRTLLYKIDQYHLRPSTDSGLIGMHDSPTDSIGFGANVTKRIG